MSNLVGAVCVRPVSQRNDGLPLISIVAATSLALLAIHASVPRYGTDRERTLSE